ncbi:MAG TPA: HepT-like ribonuclease domain-containing protein [Candidatus Nitrosotalea sp.]|nr:HepT-like ribonuclease domain-containing protein [Candidatus Nitrosotalea sp.]
MSDLALVILAEMMKDATKAIEHVDRGGDRWPEDDLIVDAVANRVRQVAELAKYQFPEDEKADYPQIPWDEIARARDFYTHHYRDLDAELLRRTVDGPLRQLVGILAAIELPAL